MEWHNIEYYEVALVMEAMIEPPECPAPEGFRVRTYAPGDAAVWARVESSSCEFDYNFDAALAHFNKEFLPHEAELPGRMFFIENTDGLAIGTATAWYKDDWNSTGRWGRLHYVAVDEAFQGHGLSKPVTAAAMRALCELHDHAYLTSQTPSWRAINLYMKWGFKPLIESAEDKKAFEIIEELIESSK